MTMRVLIDNGHGSDTSGKCSPDKSYFEWSHTRVIARRLHETLVSQGIDAELLVPETNDVPLSTRVRRANKIASELGKDNVLVVSIHSNAAGNGGWMNGRGWSVWTSPGKTKSDVAATFIYNAIETELSKIGYFGSFTPEDKAKRQVPMRSDFSDGDPDYEAKFYILTKTSCPAVLTENLFHDNRTDLKWLTSEAGIAAIVEGHARGIKEYIMNARS